MALPRFNRPGHPATLRTRRLILRPWRAEDREPFAALNADPEVGRYLAGPIPRERSDALVERVERHFERHGFGPWAIERIGGEGFIGFTGLSFPEFEAAFTPCVEVGWRIARRHWGEGYATEAARAALDYGFGMLGLDEIVAFTVAENRASRRVMEKLGMQWEEGGDFEHPNLPVGHPLRRHVLYRLTASSFGACSPGDSPDRR